MGVAKWELPAATVVYDGVLHHWKERFLHIAFPLICVQCRLDLPFRLSGPLCGRCLSRLRPLEGPQCRRCGIALEQAPNHDKKCSEQHRSLDCIRAAFAYSPPLPALIHTFKYQNRRGVGRVLGGWMAGTYGRIPEIWGMDAIVPVPLHPRRLRQRGFNQAEILARCVAECAALPLENALERVRYTRPQWRLSRGKRADNLARAFRAAPRAAVRGKNCLLIDDICTTGRTLEECAAALKSAGAARVGAFVLARD